MATDEALIFSGMRWSAAEVRGAYRLPSIESVVRGVTHGGGQAKPPGERDSRPPVRTIKVKANPRANAEGKVVVPMVYANMKGEEIPHERWVEVPVTPHIMRALRDGDLVAAEAEPGAKSKTRSPARPRRAGEPTPCTVFTVAVSGGGRPWQATEPEAFWRSFAELDFVDGDGSDVQRFVQRHGDPAGLLIQNKGGAVDTLNWIRPAIQLGEVAKAWDPADADGVSRVSEDPARLNGARETLQSVLFGIATAFDVVPEATGLTLVRRARSLHAFMMASAASALERSIPMRRCEQCTDWFEARRRDMRFCSASCRAANATALKGK